MKPITELSRDESNKAIAIALGWQQDDLKQWHHPDCKCAAMNDDDACACHDGCYWSDPPEPPDFYTDEAANTMLLEAMPHPELSLLRFKATPSFWMCRTDFTRSNEFGYEAVRNPDRKTAIAEAFKKFKGIA